MSAVPYPSGFIFRFAVFLSLRLDFPHPDQEITHPNIVLIPKNEYCRFFNVVLFSSGLFLKRYLGETIRNFTQNKFFFLLKSSGAKGMV